MGPWPLKGYEFTLRCFQEKAIKEDKNASLTRLENEILLTGGYLLFGKMSLDKAACDY